MPASDRDAQQLERATRLRSVRAGIAAVMLLVFTGCVLWWSLLEPSNRRDWQEDVARLPHAVVEGDRLTIHNLRNFDYGSEFDYRPQWLTRQYDLRQLEGVDLVAVYWMGPAIAHIFVSFAFAGGEQLAISIEARKEKDEPYSTFKGFFRQYELYYVVGDERDLIRLRTNYRKNPPEDVHVYRLQGGTLAEARQFLLEYVNKINGLNNKPEFYNSLTTNCTTNLWLHAQVSRRPLPFDWRIIASGYVPEYLYETGLLDRSKPFATLQRESHVNARAQAADQAADFSRRIRTFRDTTP